MVKLSCLTPSTLKIFKSIMKKFMIIAALAGFAMTVSAQSKEELKAEKAAQKEAEKVVKKAKTDYEMSIPNAQYGRKETNFEKLDGAKALIDEALNNKYTKNSMEALQTAANIYGLYFKKYQDDANADPDNDAKKVPMLDAASKLVAYTVKADSLFALSGKKADVVAQQTQLNNVTNCTNAAIACLTAAQNYSTSDNQNELKQAVTLAGTALYGISSKLLKSSPSFKPEQIEEYSTYAKAFKAQALSAVEGVSAADVEAAYAQLNGTKYEITGLSALCNYFREKDGNKYIEYLNKGMAKADAEQFPSFAFMLMQYQFNNDKKDDCLKTIQMIKEKCPDNENTLQAYLMEGQIYFERKLYDKAEALFADAVAKYPNDDRAITMPAKSAWMKAQNSGDKKDMQHAIDLFKKLEAAYPSETDYWGEPLYILYNNIGNLAARDKYKKYYSFK